jgi:hypothetical protein
VGVPYVARLRRPAQLDEVGTGLKPECRIDRAHRLVVHGVLGGHPLGAAVDLLVAARGAWQGRTEFQDDLSVLEVNFP